MTEKEAGIVLSVRIRLSQLQGGGEHTSQSIATYGLLQGLKASALRHLHRLLGRQPTGWNERVVLLNRCDHAVDLRNVLIHPSQLGLHYAPRRPELGNLENVHWLLGHVPLVWVVAELARRLVQLPSLACRVTVVVGP